jgi:hypothetical protein
MCFGTALPLAGVRDGWRVITTSNRRSLRKDKHSPVVNVISAPVLDGLGVTTSRTDLRALSKPTNTNEAPTIVTLPVASEKIQKVHRLPKGWRVTCTSKLDAPGDGSTDPRKGGSKLGSAEPKGDLTGSSRDGTDAQTLELPNSRRCL